MKTAEDIIRQPKYNELKNLVLICEAMDEYAKEVAIVALVKAQKEIEDLKQKVKHNAEGWQNAVAEKDGWKEQAAKLHLELKTK